eukprot:9492847-Pyramimonas_sp.AAC.1
MGVLRSSPGGIFPWCSRRAPSPHSPSATLEVPQPACSTRGWEPSGLPTARQKSSSTGRMSL